MLRKQTCRTKEDAIHVFECRRAGKRRGGGTTSPINPFYDYLTNTDTRANTMEHVLYCTYQTETGTSS